jgi:hypothetical protein
MPGDGRLLNAEGGKKRRWEGEKGRRSEKEESNAEYQSLEPRAWGIEIQQSTCAL